MQASDCGLVCFRTRAKPAGHSVIRSVRSPLSVLSASHLEPSTLGINCVPSDIDGTRGGSGTILIRMANARACMRSCMLATCVSARNLLPIFRKFKDTAQIQGQGPNSTSRSLDYSQPCHEESSEREVECGGKAPGQSAPSGHFMLLRQSIGQFVWSFYCASAFRSKTRSTVHSQDA